MDKIYRMLDRKISKDDAECKFEGADVKIMQIDKGLIKVSNLYLRIEV